LLSFPDIFVPSLSWQTVEVHTEKKKVFKRRKIYKKRREREREREIRFFSSSPSALSSS